MSIETKIKAERLAKYRSVMSGMPIEDHQKDEMIEIVLNIMQAFVDNAFSVGSAQLAMEKKQLSPSFSEAAGAIVQNGNKKAVSRPDQAPDAASPEP